MRDFTTFVRNHLGSICTLQEMNQLSLVLLEKLADIDKLQFYSRKDMKIPAHKAAKLRDAVLRLEKNEPLQYVIGETEFSGLSFNVKPGVLIPRPETEELVEKVINDFKNIFVEKSGINVVDLCSGSGCIAIALSKLLVGSVVEAWEISNIAIEIARENSTKNHTNVIFRQIDVLNFDIPEELFETIDIMISNPPYVCRSEQSEMEEKVLNNEPHIALFVENEDPLIFYRKIALIADKILKKGGYLYFEINSLLWKETLNLMEPFNFSKIEVFKDISNRERFIRIKK